MAWEYLRRISYCSLIFIVHITIVDGFSPKLVSVTRKRNSGDVFVVHTLNNSVCDNRICEEYGGLLNGDTARRKNRPAKCSCYCSKAKKPTFYNTKMGQQSCVKDLEVMKDSNGGRQHIVVIYTHLNPNFTRRKTKQAMKMWSLWDAA